MAPNEHSRPVRSVTVIGAGGAIGSHLVPHLGRMAGVGRITLVDRDLYEETNLTTQDIRLRDVGRWKATVQAARLRRIRAGLEVVALARAVEDVPWGRLRADLLLTCLDSRCARQHVNMLAVRLGLPWVDAGVGGGGPLARVTLLIPGAGRPCLECSWDERDYALLEQLYPCSSAGRPEAPPTGGTSSLGAHAASIQASVAEWLLAGGEGAPAGSTEVVTDLVAHTSLVSTLHRNPRCRLGDHSAWEIEGLAQGPAELTVADILDLAPVSLPHGVLAGMRLARSPFISRLVCMGCGGTQRGLRLAAGLSGRARRCRACGGRMAASGFDTVERLDAAALPGRNLRTSLARLGVAHGDVVSVGAAGVERHFELGRAVATQPRVEEHDDDRG